MDPSNVEEADFESNIDAPTEVLLNNDQESEEKTRFQKENIFNGLLPYADKLDNEADAMLAKIKANLGKCVMLGDIEHGCVAWTNMLHKYIILYDMRFTKEDHITFIKLMYELVTAPNLDQRIVCRFSYCLQKLLRDSYLISPRELELPWRPLYNLCYRSTLRKSHSLSTGSYSVFLRKILEPTVISAKFYFPVNTTQEILDELRPRICPFDRQTMHITMQFFQLFLPLQLPVQYHSRGHELWFHEFLKLWEVYSSSSQLWGNSVMGLMSNLAYYNIGYIDWEPYIPLMFTRFIQSFNLPVTYTKNRCRSAFVISPYYIGLWIASILGNKSNAQTYLTKLLKTVETYLHPANHGSWLTQLGQFFMYISNIVVSRINRQLYSYKSNQDESTWETEIPESHKLTDADIDAFVTSMMPIAMIGIFNKSHTHLFFDALRYLAIMRPNLVITNIIEKVYPNFGIEIEPHKMITVMKCMTTLSRPLVQGSRISNKEHAFERGQFHVLPLLFATLSCIDPNDTNKCLTAFDLIATYATMIPLVNCSQSTHEMSDEDRLLCEESSRFEDFVLQFMDKVFAWIESKSVISVRLDNNTSNKASSQLGMTVSTALHKVFSTILRQVSPSIFISALSKLRNFIVGNVLETQVAGQLVGNLCQNFRSVNGQDTLKALLPFLLEKVLNAIGENDDILTADNLDNQLLYPLLLLSRLVPVPGKYLLPYMNTLLHVIDKTIMLKSHEGNRLGCFILSNVLYSLSTISFINVERNPNYPSVQDWGTPIKIKDAKIHAYIPGEKEEEVLQETFARYFTPVVSKIQNFIKSQNTLSRDDLQTTLRILLNILGGCETALPYWSEPPLILEPYENCIERLEPFLGFSGKVYMPDGGNVRYFLVQLMAELQEIMLQYVENDTKSLTILVMVWEELILGKLKSPVLSGTMFSISYCISKKVVENEMTGSQGWFPTLVLDRVISRHHIRKNCTTPALTETHKIILMHLLKLSTSRYSRVRSMAQVPLLRALDWFPNAYIVLTPHIIEILERDPTDHHDACKGILYLITTKTKCNLSLVVRQDWGFIKRLWPALVLSGTSEKASIIHLKELVNSQILGNFFTTSIRIEIPDSAVSLATCLWTGESIKPNEPPPTEDEIRKGAEKMQERGEINFKTYNELLDILLHTLIEKKLHWRQREMAINFISGLAHIELKFSAKIVRFILNSLINESIVERRYALRVMMFVFKQQKKKRIKRKIDVTFNNNSIKECASNSVISVQPGYREDNAWLQYNYDSRPTNSAEWDERRHVHKPYIGYYVWPLELEIYSTSYEQPGHEKSNLSEQDKEIEQFFGYQQNVDRLIEYLSLEGKKGYDRLSINRVLMFKGLFRNHGVTFLGNFLPHLSKLVADKKESSQRCAAEIICGLIKGSKYWTYDMTERLWQELVPIIRNALSNLTVETNIDWVYCMAYATHNRDPNTLHWLFECLMEESPLGESETSFLECAKLSILQSALITQIWRVGQLMNRLLLRLKTRLQESPFRNVRDRLAITLVLIFQANLRFDSIVSDGNPCPQINDFLDEVYPRLQSLLEEGELSHSLGNGESTIDIKDAEEKPVQSCSSSDVIDPTREQRIRLFETVCTWIRMMVMISNLDDLSSFYKIYPIMCHLENNEKKDKELSQTCSQTIAVLACTLIQPKHVPAVLDVLTGISKSTSWSARAGCLEFLQVLVFHNMGILLSNETWISTIQDIVLKLLEDERLEVREKAAKFLGGLLHCTILPNQEALLDEFKKKASTKLINTRKRPLEGTNKADVTTAKTANCTVRLRHAGVLGMCAFIQAHPYNVPKIVPPIFECLASHLNDPQPISGTICKTLNDFKRTHCDSWTGLHGLAENFTEEQFAILQDLSVPPSYFA